MTGFQAFVMGYTLPIIGFAFGFVVGVWYAKNNDD